MKSRATHIEAFYFPLLLDQLYYFKISVANIEMREIDNFITLYFLRNTELCLISHNPFSVLILTSDLAGTKSFTSCNLTRRNVTETQISGIYPCPNSKGICITIQPSWLLP